MMRKRLIGICMIVILLCGIYGCAQTAVNTPVAVTGNVEAEDADAENVEAVEGEITNEEIISEDKEDSDITNEKAKSEDEEDIAKTDEQSLTEEKVSVAIDTDNPYFFRQSLLTADAKYFSLTEHEETVNAEVSLVKSYEEGDVYKFTIDIISDYFSTWYIQGGEPINMYFYVTPDKIYLVSRYVQTEPDGTAHYYFGGDELVTEILDTDEKLVNNSLIVCQEEETEDNTENEQYSLTTNNKENEHYSISKNGNQILCYYYQLRASGDLLYRDKFLWEKGKGLVVYLTGYGVGDYDIYLDGITGGGLTEQEGMMSDTYLNSILFGDKYVAYMKDDAADTENATLILTDLFQEGILYQEITRDFSVMAGPMSSVISVEMIDEGSIRLEYYKGEEKEIVSEVIDIF